MGVVMRYPCPMFLWYTYKNDRYFTPSSTDGIMAWNGTQ